MSDPQKNSEARPQSCPTCKSTKPELRKHYEPYAKGPGYMIQCSDKWHESVGSPAAPTPLDELKAAANLLVDYCEAHDWGTMPEPYASINPLLKLLGRADPVEELKSGLESVGIRWIHPTDLRNKAGEFMMRRGVKIGVPVDPADVQSMLVDFVRAEAAPTRSEATLLEQFEKWWCDSGRHANLVRKAVAKEIWRLAALAAAPVSTSDPQLANSLDACVQTIIADAVSRQEGNFLFNRTRARISAVIGLYLARAGTSATPEGK